MHFARLTLTLAVAGAFSIDLVAQNTLRVPSQFATIQAAINASADGDTVLVAPGTFPGNIDFLGRDIVVRSEAGRDHTTIVGDGSTSVVSFRNREPRSAVLEGFTVRGGRASEGGGIVMFGVDATVRHNLIVDNFCCSAGGGIGCSGGAARIEYNIIRNNRQSGCSGGPGGGGISIRGASSTEIYYNLIERNVHGSAAGAISLFAAGTPEIVGNVMRDNTGGSGGAMWIVNRSDAYIANNLFLRNRSTRGQGGGIDWLVPSSGRGPFVVNNTFVDNDAQNGSGISADGFDRAALIQNNVVVPRAGQSGIFCGGFNDRNSPIIRFNDVFAPAALRYGGLCPDQTGSNGNISVDPRFVDPARGDFHLAADSACVDVGENIADLPALDLDRDDRVIDGPGAGAAIADLGMDEFSGRYPFGFGCAGADGAVPRVATSGGLPVLGNGAFVVELDRAASGAPGALIVGGSNTEWRNRPLPQSLDFLGLTGCSLFVAADICVDITTSATGTAAVSLGIPDEAAVAGADVYVQWIVLDRTAQRDGAVSDALAIEAWVRR